jgi:uncharacterized protein YukE
MMITEKELLDLKTKVEEAKTTVAELTGQKNALVKQLKEDWKCNSVSIAEDKLKKMDKDILALENQIEKGIKELEEKLNPKE